jgi:hypothetical protein
VQRIEDAASVAAHIVCLLTRKQIAESVTGARSKPFSVAASVSDPVV